MIGVNYTLEIQSAGITNTLCASVPSSSSIGNMPEYFCVTFFLHYPRCHASPILNDGGFQRVNHSSAEIVCGLCEQRLVCQISFRAVRK